MDADSGFAVAMDFNLQEQTAVDAVSSLLPCLAFESKSI